MVKTVALKCYAYDNISTRKKCQRMLIRNNTITWKQIEVLRCM